MTEVVRRRLVVTGRVQGVGYRESCARQARAAGVSGRVGNLADGRVEVVLEGAATAVEELSGWCRGGPRLARVRAVQVFEETPTGETGFRVE